MLEVEDFNIHYACKDVNDALGFGNEQAQKQKMNETEDPRTNSYESMHTGTHHPT